VKRLFKQLGKWTGKQLLQLFRFLKGFVFMVPVKFRQGIFAIAHWSRLQLDKGINKEQRERLHSLIFKNETPQGRLFDTIIIGVIFFSIIIAMLETVSEFHQAYRWTFYVFEWIFTVIFTIEYIFRLYSAKQPIRYATSFFGIVDLLAILPSYLSIFFIGAQSLIIVRALRLLRVFRIFKMGHFVNEGEVIIGALRASRTKIYVFLSFVILMAVIIGSIMYMVEGPHNVNLDNIPKGVYWAIVTLTTVGYGDVTAITPFGKFLSTIVMIMGYGVIAVPTGIVTAEISGRVMNKKEVVFIDCKNCNKGEHHTEAVFCHSCGHTLGEQAQVVKEG
jgi:voltage-gated potassium channel